MGSYLSRPVCIGAGLLYPAYASFKALETPRVDDDKQWLTYWIVYAITTSLETITEKIISWFPGYYALKTLLLVWMMLPATRGAAVLYENLIFPLLKKYEPILDEKMIQIRDGIHAHFQKLRLRSVQALRRGVQTIKDGSWNELLNKVILDVDDKNQSLPESEGAKSFK